MAEQFRAIAPKHRAFIEKQHVFFVASAAPGSRINLSPKGLDSLRVLDERTALYLDLTGSGNERGAHLSAEGRLTFFFCAFDGAPLILRLYGRGRVLRVAAANTRRCWRRASTASSASAARQMVQLDVDLVQTSCGYAVPNRAYPRRATGASTRGRTHKGPDGLVAYRAGHNVKSIDGLPSGFVESAAQG